MKSSLRQTATPQHRSRPRGNDRPHPKTPSSAQHPRRRFLGLAAGAAALPAVSRVAWAQVYPSRPITMVVPFHPGGQTDVIARNLAERMKASLGQPVIIENVTGAGGTIATGRVARAAPAEYRPDRLARREWCDLHSPIRFAKRFRAGGSPFGCPVPAYRKEGNAGRRSEGSHRLAEGEPGQGIDGGRRRGQPGTGCRRPYAKGNWNPLWFCTL